MKHLSKSPWGFAERFCSQVILPRTQPERRPNLLGWASLPGWSRIPWKTPSEPLRSLVHSCITNLAILSCHLTSLRLIQVPRKLVNLHQNMPWNDTVRMCHWHIDSTICATPVSIWFIFTNFHSSIDISTQQMIKVHTNHFFLPSGTKISNGVWLISIFLMTRKPGNVQSSYILYINPIHPLNPIKNDNFLRVKSPWADLHSRADLRRRRAVAVPVAAASAASACHKQSFGDCWSSAAAASGRSCCSWVMDFLCFFYWLVVWNNNPNWLVV